MAKPSIEIGPMRRGEERAAVTLHAATFPGFFLTKLGELFMA
jgi:hypothetical protein